MKTVNIEILATTAEAASQRIDAFRCGAGCGRWITVDVMQDCEEDCGTTNLCPKCINDHGCEGN
jgi:hypothetical protein